MPTEEELESLDDAMLANATGPAAASVDGVSTNQHSIQDQIALRKFLGGKAVGANPHLALRWAKIVPPSTA